MKILRTQPARRRRNRGFLEADMAVGLVILTLAVLPLGYSMSHERRALRMEYRRALANEIVDGEIEILAAGAARPLPDGTRAYTVHAESATQLPRGHFQLTKNGNHLRLEWTPDAPHGVGAIVRETTLK